MISITKKGQLQLEVFIQPQASKNQIIGEHNGELKIKINAPPIDGAANEELIFFLAKKLKMPKRNIFLIKGETSRHKTLIISDLNIDELKSRLDITYPSK